MTSSMMEEIYCRYEGEHSQRRVQTDPELDHVRGGRRKGSIGGLGNHEARKVKHRRKDW